MDINIIFVYICNIYLKIPPLLLLKKYFSGYILEKSSIKNKQGANMYGDGFRFEQGSFLKIYFICFRELPEWNESQAATPYWRFFYDFEPGVVLHLGNRKIACDPGHFYIIPGFTQFSAVSNQPVRRFYIHFGLGSHVPENNTVYELPAAPHTLELINEFAEAGDLLHNTRSTILYAQSILARELLKLPPGALDFFQKSDPRIDNAIKYISEHCHTPQDNAYLAQMAGMSRNAFLRLFEQQTGLSPQFYWRKKRIEKSCELLMSTDLTIDEIAEKTGFADRYHFTRVFSNILKTSPAKFRKKH